MSIDRTGGATYKVTIIIIVIIIIIFLLVFAFSTDAIPIRQSTTPEMTETLN